MVIGRFQPFHNGHLYLVKEAIKLANNIKIAIGSTNISNKSNPLTYSQRCSIIQKMIEYEDITDNVLGVYSIPDYPEDNDLWWNELVGAVGHFDFVVSHHSLVVEICKNVKIDCIQPKLYKRYLYEGQKIRKLYEANKSWKDRIPLYLVEETDIQLKFSCTNTKMCLE